MNAHRFFGLRALPRAHPIALFLLAAVAGCADLAIEPDPVPSGLVVHGPPQRLTVGRTARMNAAVTSSAGGDMPDQAVTFISRDTTTLTVDPAGTITAVRAGEAYVVATVGSFADSALVEVAFELLPGEGRARLRFGGTDATILMPEPQGISIDFLSRTEEDSWVVFGDNAGSTDTALVVVLPSDPDGKRVTLTTWNANDQPDWTEFKQTQAYLWIERDTTQLMVPLQGWLEVSLDGTLPAPGIREGLMRTRVVGSGRAYRYQDGYPEGTWILTNDEYDVVMDLRPTSQHETVGTSAGQITGLAQPITWTLHESFWSTTSWGSRPFELYIGDETEITVGMPGTVSVDVGATSRTDRASFQLIDYGRQLQGLGASGRVDITRYVAPPAPDLYGEIQGKVTVRGTTSSWSSADSSTFDAVFDFHAPVRTESGGGLFGAPSAVSRAAALGPVGRMPGIAR